MIGCHVTSRSTVNYSCNPLLSFLNTSTYENALLSLLSVCLAAPVCFAALSVPGANGVSKRWRRPNAGDAERFQRDAIATHLAEKIAEVRFWLTFPSGFVEWRAIRSFLKTGGSIEN